MFIFREIWLDWNSYTCRAAISFGNLEYLKWIRANGCPWSEDVLEYTYNFNEEMIKWAILDGCPVSTNAYNQIVENDNLDLLNWLFDQNITPNEKSMKYAASENVIKWLINKGSAEVCEETARNGRLDLIQLAIDSGASYNLVKIASNAAAYGYINILQWTQEQGITWEASIFAEAIHSQNKQVITWLFENKCPWDEESCSNVAKNSNLTMLK